MLPAMADAVLYVCGQQLRRRFPTSTTPEIPTFPTQRTAKFSRRLRARNVLLKQLAVHDVVDEMDHLRMLVGYV